MKLGRGEQYSLKKRYQNLQLQVKIGRASYARSIPSNVVQPPCCQDLVRAINTAPQSFKKPNNEKL